MDMKIEEGEIVATKDGIYFSGIEGMLNALIEIGCICSEQECICIKVEPTIRQGLYRVRQMKCEVCDVRSECVSLLLSRHRSAEQSNNRVFENKTFWWTAYRCLKKVFCRK